MSTSTITKKTCRIADTFTERVFYQDPTVYTEIYVRQASLVGGLRSMYYLKVVIPPNGEIIIEDLTKTPLSMPGGVIVSQTGKKITLYGVVC